MTNENKSYVIAAHMREELRASGWMLLAHTQGRQGLGTVHHFAFGHPQGSWVTGTGASEELALKEVCHKIDKYLLHNSPVAVLPYEISLDEDRAILRFCSPQAAENFVGWFYAMKDSASGR